MFPSLIPTSIQLSYFTPHACDYWLIQSGEIGYVYIQDDVLATGIMSFMLHEIAYFGRSGMWAFLDFIPFFNKYKIQNVCISTFNLSNRLRAILKTLQRKMPPPEDYWKCLRLVILCHFVIDIPQLW